MLEDLKLGRRLVVVIIVVGFFIGFGSGLIENASGPASVPGNKYYGFPLAWRAVNTSTGGRYEYPVELFEDCLFGVLLVSIIAGVTIITENSLMKKSRKKVK
jgi:hypothetical protein